MGSYGDFAQNDATATSRNVATYIETDGSRVQVVRRHSATASASVSWTLATTAATVLSADVQRVGYWLVNTGGSRVYIALGSDTPSATAHYTYLDPGERLVSDPETCELAVRMVAATASGTLTGGTMTAA